MTDSRRLLILMDYAESHGLDPIGSSDVLSDFSIWIQETDPKGSPYEVFQAFKHSGAWEKYFGKPGAF